MQISRKMSTEEIKRGLENIKRAQLEVLKELKGDSYLINQKSPRIDNSKYIDEQQNDRNFQFKDKTESRIKDQVSSEQSPKSKFSQKSQQGPAGKNQSYNFVSRHKAANSIEALKQEFSSQREELKKKFNEITTKLNTIQKQTQMAKQQQQQELNQKLHDLKARILELQSENTRLRTQMNQKNALLFQMQKSQKKHKLEVQLKIKQKAIVENELKSLTQQNNKLSRTLKQLESQIKEQSLLLKQYKDEKQNKPKSNFNPKSVDMDLVMKEVKSISSSHDFLFNKLKQSAATLDLSWVERESEIQNSFSRLLEYLENISNASSSGNYINDQNFYSGLNTISQQGNKNIRNNHFGYQFNNQQQKDPIRRSLMIAESRVEGQQDLEYFVREIGGNQTSLRRQMSELRQENESLRKKVKQLNAQLLSLQPIVAQKNNFTQQSNRLIALQLEQMRQQLARLKRFKAQTKEQNEEAEKQIVKYKIKSRQSETKLQTAERKLVQATNEKFALEKKCQQQDLQITSLNSIIKELNSKLIANPDSQPLNTLRQEFNKLLQSNSLTLRENQTLKAMNEGLQAQIANLKYEKQQYESNNKQKHELIEREIKQRNNLLQEIDKKQSKILELNQQIDKLKGHTILNQEHSLKQRKQLEDLLEQKNSEVLSLRKQIEELYQQSRQHHQLKFMFDKLQAEFKQLSRKSLKMGETLTHLWSVKEAEYHNIDKILGMLRDGDKNQDNLPGSVYF